MIAADRRQAIPPILMSAIGNRLVLRQTDDGGYIDYGISAAISKGIDLPNGRGLCENRLVQVGLISTDPSAAAQGAAIARFAADLGDIAADDADVVATSGDGQRAARGRTIPTRSRSGARTCSRRSSRSASGTAGCA